LQPVSTASFPYTDIAFSTGGETGAFATGMHEEAQRRAGAFCFFLENPIHFVAVDADRDPERRGVVLWPPGE